MNNLVSKIMAVQKELKAPKGNYNSFGKYKYRSCEDILEAAKPLLNKNGLVLTITDDIVGVGNRIYVKATARITDGTDEIQTVSYAREAEFKKGMDESQITGTASSYARKYALNGLFCIDDTKDADTPNYSMNQQAPQPAMQHTSTTQMQMMPPQHQASSQQQPYNGPSKEEIRSELLQTAQSFGMTPADVAQKYKLNANSTVDQLADALEALKQNGGV